MSHRPPSPRTSSRAFRRLLVGSLTLAASVWGAGCGSPPPPGPAAPVATKTGGDSEQSPDAAGEAERSDAAPPADAADRTSTGDSEKPAETPPEAGTSDASAKTAEPKPEAPKTEAAKLTPAEATAKAAAVRDELGVDRLVLLTPGGPLLIELVTTLDGRPLGESLDATLARLLNDADADQDGRTTWEEIVRQPAFQRGVYGNQPIAADNDRRQVIQRYDWNRDKLVSRDELLRWLVREVHRAKPLVIDSLASGREPSANESNLLRALDTSGDGRLSADELAAAAGRLQARDTDEDEVIVPTELRTAEEMAAGAAMARNEPGAPAALAVGAKTDWATFQRHMQDAYSLGGPLTPEAWPAAPELFRELDVNGDGFVGRSEWSLLRVVEPHARLRAALGGPGDSLALERVAETLAESRQEGLPPNTFRFDRAAGRTELLLVPTPIPDFTVQAKAALDQFDANKNGYLEEDEATTPLQQTGGSFADVDADGDGKLVADELVAALKKRQAVSLDQARVAVGFRPDAWWQFADATGDGRLDAREIESLAARFQALDRDGDGAIERDEVPATFVFSLARGGASGAPGTDAPPPIADLVRATAGEPLWFTAMDANGDGMIGRREFPGDAAQFADLDRDGDGRIEWSEIRDRFAPPASGAPEAKPAAENKTPDAGADGGS